MEPSGLGAGGLLIEQGEPVMVSVRKSAMRLGLALWPELPERAVVRLVHAGTTAWPKSTASEARGSAWPLVGPWHSLAVAFHHHRREAWPK